MEKLLKTYQTWKEQIYNEFREPNDRDFVKLWNTLHEQKYKVEVIYYTSDITKYLVYKTSDIKQSKYCYPLIYLYVHSDYSDINKEVEQRITVWLEPCVYREIIYFSRNPNHIVVKEILDPHQQFKAVAWSISKNESIYLYFKKPEFLS